MTVFYILLLLVDLLRFCWFLLVSVGFHGFYSMYAGEVSEKMDTSFQVPMFLLFFFGIFATSSGGFSWLRKFQKLKSSIADTNGTYKDLICKENMRLFHTRYTMQPSPNPGNSTARE